jgi:hypothetical protein
MFAHGNKPQGCRDETLQLHPTWNAGSKGPEWLGMVRLHLRALRFNEGILRRRVVSSMFVLDQICGEIEDLQEREVELKAAESHRFLDTTS